MLTALLRSLYIAGLTCLVVGTSAPAYGADPRCAPPKKPPPVKRVPTPTPPDFGIVYFGDSTAYWTGRHLYTVNPKLHVDNRARGGMTLGAYVAQQHETALKAGKGVVILSFGANDADSKHGQVEPGEWSRELGRVALDLRQRGLAVVIETVPAMQVERLAPDALTVPLPVMVSAARSAAVYSGATLCDRYGWMQGRTWGGDGVHLTDAALKGWAPQLMACVNRAGVV